MNKLILIKIKTCWRLSGLCVIVYILVVVPLWYYISDY